MSALLDRLQRLAQYLNTLSEWIGRTIAWLALALVLLVFAIVVLRYGFEIGSIAAQEGALFLHALLFLFGAGYTLKHDGHVRVDIFYRRFSPTRQAWVDLLGSLLLLLPVCLFIIVSSWDYVSSAWALREGSREAGGLPGVFLLKTSIPIMAGLLLLQGLAQALRALLVINGRTPPTDTAAAREL